jgi:hypothetical protein
LTPVTLDELIVPGCQFDVEAGRPHFTSTRP